MPRHLKILILEDVKSDVLLIDYQLRKAKFSYLSKPVKTIEGFKSEVLKFEPDVILSDYFLAGFTGGQALEIALKCCKDTPFIFVTGHLDEKVAVEFLKKGAWDYVLKQNYIRLVPAIENALRLRIERLKVNLALKIKEQSKQKYQDLYENAPDMYLSINLNTGLIRECNQTLATKTGYSKQEIINKPILSFYPKGTSVYIKEVIVPYLFQNGKVENAELKIVKKDKSIIDVLVNINSELDNNNRIKNIKVVLRDVTLRNIQNNAIKESEARFKTIFNTSNDPILILDFFEKKIPLIENVNQVFLTKLGLNKKEIIGKPLNLFFPKIKKEEFVEHVELVKSKGVLKDFIIYNLINGNTLYFDTISSLIKLNNKDYILISGRDVTEKHLSNIKLKTEKEKLEALYEEYSAQNDNLHETIKTLAANKKDLKNKINIINRSPSVSFVWKNETNWPVEYVSENVEQIFGYSKNELLSGKVKYEQIIHPEDLERVSNEVEHSFKTNKNIKHKPYRIITKNGNTKWVKDDTVVIRKNNKVAHFEGIISDITEIVESHEIIELSKNKYKSILDANPDMTVICSKEKVIEFANPKAEKEFGDNLEGTTCYKSLFGLNSQCEWCGHKKINNTNEYTNEVVNYINKNRYIISYSEIKNEDKSISYMSSYKDVTAISKIQSEKLKFLKTIEAGINEIYLFDPNTFQFQYVNKRAIDNLGYSQKELFQLTPLSLNPDINKIALNNLIKPLKKNETKIIKFETIHVRKNGTKYPIEASLQLIKQAEDEGILAVVSDISERIQKDEIIKKLSTAINQSPVTVVITNANGDIEFVNPKFEESTGYKASEAIGKNPRILKSEKQDHNFHKNLWQTITSGRTWRGEFYNKRKNGTYYWEDATISPVKNAAGVITHFIALKEDITEKKIIEQKLISSEIHFRKLFENSLIGMYLTTPEGKILRANNALCNMLGFKSFEELAKINLDVNKEQSSKRDEFIKEIEAKGQVRGLESIWRKKNGENIYVRESARRYVNENGNVFYEGTVENITNQMHATKALQEIGEFNQKIIKVGKLGHATFNEKGDCVSVNKSYVEIIGATKEQALAQNFKTIENWKISGLNEKALKCLQEGTQERAIVDAESSFKKDVWLDINLSRIYKKGEVLLLVIIKDISLFMKAKQRQFQTKAEYVNLISNVNVPILGVSKIGKINEWNNTIQELTGYKRKDVKGKKLIDVLIKKQGLETVENIINPSSGLEISNYEINFKTKYNDELKLLISTTIRRDIHNKIDGIILIGQDITAIQNSKIELEKQVDERTYDLILALKKEKDLGDMKSQFVSMASHEFRTPLSAISFASGFLKKYWTKIDDDKRNAKLAKIETQVKHMTNLLEDVLTFGKTESGKIIYKPKEVNLINFFKVIIEEIENINGNKHKVEFEFDNPKYTIMLDEKIGRNIFMNLLTNAIKFSPNTSFVFLKVNTKNTEVQIEIIDKGIGIYENELEHIFTPFHRGQNINTIQGTGLGLAIVKESVDLMKGKIEVESKVGEGTKFKVYIPKME